MALAQYSDTIFQTDSGRAYSGVKVEALLAGVPVQLYRDEAGMQPASQITSNTNGLFTFWVEEGTYTLRYTLGGVTLGSQAGTEIYNLVKEVELANDTGAEGVGVATGDNLQEFLDTLDQTSTQKANAAAVGVSGSADNLGTINTSLVDDNLTVKQAFESAGDNLFAPAGAALIGYSAGSGATARTAQDKLRDFVNVSDFGAVGNGVADDTAAFAAAAAFLVTRSNGGRILCNARYKIGSTLSLPDGVSIESVGACHGTLYPSSDGNRGATLIIASTATILLNNGSGLTGLFIKRDGLTYGITSAQVASTFQGTAITLATNRGDQVLEDLYIMGFDTAIKSQDTTTVGSAAQNNRVRIFNVAMDCVNGIWLHNSYDVSYIDRVHCWPYVTVGSVAEAGDAQLKRSGAAIKLTGKNDWTKVYNSFSFGYGVGSQVTDGHSVTFLNVSHDHPPGSTDGSKGYYFDGDASEIRVIGGQVAGKQYGAHVNCTTSSGRLAVTFSSTNIWVTTTQSLRIQVGSVQVIGGSLRNDPTSPNGIGIKNENTGTAEVTVVGVDFAGLTTAIDNQATTSILRYSACTFRNVTTQITNAYAATTTPAVTATTGTITTAAATCQYRRDAGYVSFSMNITVTTNGTGAGTLRTTLPFSAASGVDYVFVGRDRGVGGKSITATLIGGGNTLDIKNYDNTYPAADGSVIVLTGTYRVA